MLVLATAVASIGGCLAGCAAPDLTPPPRMLAASDLESARSLPPTSINADWPRQEWWKAWGDPTLDALVDEGLRGSPDVASAIARIRQAQGTELVARSNGLPQVTGSGSVELEKRSYNSGTPRNQLPQGWRDYGSLGLSLNFDLDLWGKNKAQLAAATSAGEAALAEEREAELTLSSNIVSGYFDLARLLARAEVLQQALAAREETAKLAQARFGQGLDTADSMGESRALVAEARRSLEANDESIAVRRHAIAALIGAGPDRTADLTPRPISVLAATPFPADAGIALVGRRPDIVVARKLVESAGHSVEYAKRSFLPDISLSGLIGMTSLGIGNLFDAGSDYGNIGPAISLPIFDGGALQGRYRLTRGGYDTAIANYNKTVIKALQEVADALAQRNSALEQEIHAKAAQKEADHGNVLATLRYKGGLGTNISVLSIQQTAFTARLAVVDTHFMALADEVALIQALGGGYAEGSYRKAPVNE